MSKGKNKLRIFFLEDNPDDVELELHELGKAGIETEYDVAGNRSEFMDKLPGFKADIILADYSLPDITGIEAIRLCKEKGMDIPVILITGDGNELIAVDSLRLGALDYIIKRNIAGLPARVTRALEIWEDRKARERAEAEEKRLQQLLIETQKMESIGRLAGGVAHDFNNILSGIIGYAELCLGDAAQNAPVRAKLQSIVTLSRKGADLVKQLLIFGKRAPMELREVDLNAFIRESVQFIRRIVEETVEIRIVTESESPVARCDTGKFTQVLMNLILNARDAMNGKGVVEIKTRRLPLPEEVPCKPGKEFICLAVSDSGSGISQENLSKIFEPFFTTKEAGKGTGLGLSIVYSVVNAHGGHVRVLSEINAGTTFEIYLPLVTSFMKNSAPSSGGKAEEKGDIRGRETLLIVEDEDILRELASTVLGSFGYRIITAEHSQDALDKYTSGPQKIDLVISDMHMPGKNGLELFRELKTMDPGAKFILMTGHSITGKDEDLIGKINGILPKPFTPAALARLTRNVLDGTGCEL
ncbi:MAG TPA: response regulator [Dissulfurispiraceae bacterium]